LMLLGACTATIDQSSLLPTLTAPTVAQVVEPPAGYAREERLLDLPGLGAVHVVRLTRPESRATLFYSGGNGSFVSSSGSRLNRLATITGTDIITFDYPGRGGTTVPNTTDALIAFGPALIATVRATGWIRSGALYSYGFSLGGATAANMARTGGFDGLILEATAADIPAVARDKIPALLKPFVRVKVSEEFARFDYAGYAVAGRTPILVIASEDDRTVNVRTTRRFAEELRKAGAIVTLVEVPGGHGAALSSVLAQTALRNFIRN
jgi:pimeloyl-ACP methyl ester carboxylesterase